MIRGHRRGPRLLCACNPVLTFLFCVFFAVPSVCRVSARRCFAFPSVSAYGQRSYHVQHRRIRADRRCCSKVRYLQLTGTLVCVVAREEARSEARFLVGGSEQPAEASLEFTSISQLSSPSFRRYPSIPPPLLARGCTGYP